ncbi:MAG: FAD-dependent oxidoreductase [Pseudaminobacter sp.]
MPAVASSDYVVIGGGIVGAAVSYGLARAGEKVLLLDEGDIAFRAARGNFGNVWVQGKGGTSPAYADLTRRAANDWAAFASELEERTGQELHFRRPGAFYICFSPEELQRRAETMARIDESATVASPFEVLDRAELVKRLPEIGQDVAGATFCSSDGTANPLHLLRSLISGTILLGGRYLPRHAALGLRADGQGFAIDTQAGIVNAGKVVLTAGLGNEKLAPQLGMSAPVRPVRGQIMVTEKIRPFLHFGTNFIRQTLEGGCLFGESSEEAGMDDATTLPVLRETARRAIAAFPLLRNARVVRAWGALRIMTRDGVPVYQQSPTYPGAFVLSVHSGVTLAPFHCGAMVAALRAGVLDTKAFEPFSPERFHVQAA